MDDARLAAALVVLAEAGVPPDMQEVLVRGSLRLRVHPGALKAALAASRRMDREELARVISKRLYGDFDKMTSWIQQDARDAADAVIAHLSNREQRSGK